jgi:hypothetical protein
LFVLFAPSINLSHLPTVISKQVHSRYTTQPSFVITTRATLTPVPASLKLPMGKSSQYSAISRKASLCRGPLAQRATRRPPGFNMVMAWLMRLMSTGILKGWVHDDSRALSLTLIMRPVTRGKMKTRGHVTCYSLMADQNKRLLLRPGYSRTGYGLHGIQ